MTLLSEKPVLLDDFELLRIAATPRTRLFPILLRASAFAPMILVCCVLPALQLLAQHTLDEQASLWGLRSLAAANATTWAELREPGLNEHGQPLLFQPPLPAWLNAIVFRILGPSYRLSSALVSITAIAIAIALTTRLAWRIGGASIALIAALMACSHPLVLESAVVPGSNSVGLCLMLLSVYAFQRHLEGTAANQSFNLVISSIAWGLSLLTVGSLSLILPLLYAWHALNQRTGLGPAITGHPFRIRFVQGLPVLKSTLRLMAIGLLIGGSWEIVMGVKYGRAFWLAWWPTFPVVLQLHGASDWRSDLAPILQATSRAWFRQNALLIPWLVIGLERSWNELRIPSSELSRRRHQLLMFWWMIAASGRVLTEIVGTRFYVNTELWNLALLPPTILLATVGVGTVIERTTTRRGEFCLIVLVAGLIIASTTNSWTAATTSMASTAVFLIFAPMLIPSLGRSEGGWSEQIWRRLLQTTVYASLLSCFSVGIHLQYLTSSDEDHLAQFRNQIAALPDVRRVTFLVARDPAPVTLTYLLRCRWPKAEMVTSEGWDEGLSREMNEESNSPHSRFLILDWTRRDVRLSADMGQSWQISPVGDPMRYLGRRLSLTMISPRT